MARYGPIWEGHITMDTADVLIHIDEKIDHDRRVGIVDSLNANSGVREVKSSDNKPHILIV